MSRPFDISEHEPLRSAATEVISGMSALNMHPHPIPPDQQRDGTGWLSDTDYWVRHSMDHFHQAMEGIRQGEKQIRVLKGFIFKLYKERRCPTEFDIDMYYFGGNPPC